MNEFKLTLVISTDDFDDPKEQDLPCELYCDVCQEVHDTKYGPCIYDK